MKTCKTLLFLSFLLTSSLTACGGVPDIFEVVEPVNGCLGPYYVKNNIGSLNRSKLLQNEEMLKALFTTPYVYHPQTDWGEVDYTKTLYHEKLLPNAKAFCEAFGGIHITYEWVYYFSCGTDTCDGLDNFKGIYLDYTGNALLHEMLHVYEWENGIVDTGNHPNWDLKGYYYLNNTLWHQENSPNTMTGPNGELAP
jgi:hypothetical protein